MDVSVEDVAQEALLRLFQTTRMRGYVASPRAWLHGTVIHILRDRVREALARPGIQALEFEESVQARSNPHPEDLALLRDFREQAPDLLDSLPHPDREIASLQYLEGWSRRQLSVWLRSWRPVGEDEVRRLIRRTHAMLAAIGRGEDLRRHWPSAWSKKNGWLATPPHPFPDYEPVRVTA